MQLNFPLKEHIRCRHHRCNAGFTLLELMVVVGIITVIVAFAIPAYNEYMKKARRSEAATMLLENAQALQSYHSVRNTYVGATLPSLQSPATGTAKYNIEFLAPPTVNAFTLKAVPVNTDTDCGTLTLTNTGVKDRVGGNKDINYCWK